MAEPEPVSVEYDLDCRISGNLVLFREVRTNGACRRSDRELPDPCNCGCKAENCAGSHIGLLFLQSDDSWYSNHDSF